MAKHHTRKSLASRLPRFSTSRQPALKYTSPAGAGENKVVADLELRPSVADFHHKPLASTETCFRLIQIGAGQEQDGLQLSLSAWERSEAPEYNTLSYTWGDNTDMRSITVDNATLWVTRNCWTALHQLRQLTEHTMYFWIDSICINQLDDQERSAQVNVMGDIYRESRCFVSLGPHAKSYDYLFERLAPLASPSYGSFQSWLEDHDDAQLSLLYRGLQEVFSSNYWQRVWTMQEFALSRSVYLLSWSYWLPWVTLHRLLNCMANPIPRIRFRLSSFDFTCLSQPHVASMAALRQMLKRASAGEPRKASLGDMILFAGRKFCCDSRDKVFGILSLVTWHRGEKPLQAKYSWSRERLATEICLRMIPSRESSGAFYAVADILGLLKCLEGFAKDLLWPSTIYMPLAQEGRLDTKFASVMISSSFDYHTRADNDLLSTPEALSIEIPCCQARTRDDMRGLRAGDYLLRISWDRVLHLIPRQSTEHSIVNVFKSRTPFDWQYDTQQEGMILTMPHDPVTLAVLYFQQFRGYNDDWDGSIRDWLRLYRVNEHGPPQSVWLGDEGGISCGTYTFLHRAS